MTTTTRNLLSVGSLKGAIEGRNASTLSDFYAEDAVMQIIDHDNPPSRPRELRGKRAIAAYYDDICGRAMSHRVESAVDDGNGLAFTQVCTYPNGAKVLCATLLELENGKIIRQTAVQAWDA
jgi:hypothetical protein